MRGIAKLIWPVEKKNCEIECISKACARTSWFALSINFIPLVLSFLILGWSTVSADLALAESVLRRANGGDVAIEPDPGKIPTTFSRRVRHDIFEGLLRPSVDGSFKPGVAKDWKISQDGKTYTFYLRADAKWSDGAPVTAGDFVFSWKRLLIQDNGERKWDDFYCIRDALKVARREPEAKFGAYAADPNTLVVELEHRSPSFLQSLADSAFLPVPQDRVEMYDKEWTSPKNIIGNGPFKLTERNESSLTLERSATYWDARSVKLDKVIYYPIESAAEQFKRFRTGQLDLTDQFPLTQLSWIRANIPKSVVDTPLLRIQDFKIRYREGSWTADVNARRALSLAIDREIIATQVVLGLADATDTLIPKGYSNYKSQELRNWPSTQIARENEARRLWSLKGKRPQKITVTFSTTESNIRIMRAVSDMWKHILGIDVVFENIEVGQRMSRENQGDFEISFASHSTYRNPLPERITRFTVTSEEYEKLKNKMFQAEDSATRNAYLAAAETIILNDAFNIPILQMRAQTLVSPRVRGCICSPTDLVFSQDLEIIQ